MKRINKVLSLVLSGSMVASILATGALAAAAPKSSYSDVPATASYSEAVEYLSAEKIMDGTGDGKFEPQNTVTRAQVVTVLGRMAKAQQVETDTFTDIVPNSWYSGYVGWAVENGIVQGDGNGHFMPNDNVTSEHLNLMLSRYARTINQDVKFYDTGARTVTRADLAQRLYQFYVKPETPATRPPTVITNTVTQVVEVEKPDVPGDIVVPAVVQLDHNNANSNIMGYLDNGVYAFKGIRYGTAQHFKRAAMVTNYGTASAPINCLTNGAVSPQGGTNSSSSKAFAAAAFMTPSDSDMFSIEANCLNLNVWTKSLDRTANKPVLVFFHGGGTTEGSAIELKSYDGKYFTDYTDVLFVSVNARLNYTHEQ